MSAPALNAWVTRRGGRPGPAALVGGNDGVGCGNGGAGSPWQKFPEAALRGLGLFAVHDAMRVIG
jgi:hypothetical protein